MCRVLEELTDEYKSSRTLSVSQQSSFALKAYQGHNV